MKKLFTYVLFSFLVLNTFNVYASTNTFDRTTADNYGVKKNIKITDENKNYILKTPLVDSSEKIYDYADVLTEQEEMLLKKRIDQFIEKNNMDLVIVIPSFDYYSDSENEDYAADFYDYNDFGMNFNNNSGILFLRNANEINPYYDMYTFGNAQLFFNKSRYDYILDGIYDNIHGKNYYMGFSDFINKTDYYINLGIPNEMKNYYVTDEGYLTKRYIVPWLMCFGFASLLTLIIMVIMVKKNKMIHKAYDAANYLDKDSVNITNRKDTFIRSDTSSYRISSNSGGSSGGGFSSSGSSSFGHSSGGGRHG